MLLNILRREVFEIVDNSIEFQKTSKFHFCLHVCEIAPSVSSNTVRVALLGRVWDELFQQICSVRILIKMTFLTDLIFDTKKFNGFFSYLIYSFYKIRTLFILCLSIPPPSVFLLGNIVNNPSFLFNYFDFVSTWFFSFFVSVSLLWIKYRRIFVLWLLGFSFRIHKLSCCTYLESIWCNRSCCSISNRYYVLHGII